MSKTWLSVLLVVAVASCSPSECGPPKPAPGAGPGTKIVVSNRQQVATTVYVAFGSDSKVGVADWPFCTGSGLTCTFPLTATTSQPLPTKGAYLNATLSFGSAVTCGVTKAEINVNNPAWYDTYDVSLVDGYSNNVGIQYTPPTAADAGGSVQLGPVLGATGNEQVLGVFPLGCDVCVARQSPPCGMSKGTDGCKTGSQYNPSVACQYQGAVKGGGGSAEIVLFP